MGMDFKSSLESGAASGFGAGLFPVDRSSSFMPFLLFDPKIALSFQKGIVDA
jgi:hypothetical protein